MYISLSLPLQHYLNLYLGNLYLGKHVVFVPLIVLIYGEQKPFMKIRLNRRHPWLATFLITGRSCNDLHLFAGDTASSAKLDTQYQNHILLRPAINVQAEKWYTKRSIKENSTVIFKDV